MRTRKIGFRFRTSTRIGAVLTLAAGAVLVAATPSYAAAEALSVVSPNRLPSGVSQTVIVTAPTTAFNTATAQLQVAACPTSGAKPSATTWGTATSSIVDATSVTTLSPSTKAAVVIPSTIANATTSANQTVYLCIYNTGASNGATYQGTFTVGGPALTLSSSVGPSGGGNVLTLTASGTTFTASSAVEFQWPGPSATANGCANTYTTPVAVAGSGNPAVQTAGIVAASTTYVNATTLRVTVPAGLTLLPNQTSATYNVCVYASASSGAQQAATAMTYPGSGLVVYGAYTVTGMALNLGGIVSGPASTASTTLIATAPPGQSIPTDAVAQIQYGDNTTASGVPTGHSGCAATYQTPGAAAQNASTGVQTAGVYNAAFRSLAPDRVTVTVPSIPLLATAPANQVTAEYWICLYSAANTSTGTLVAANPVPYTISTKATLTSVSPAAGSSNGGTRITVQGSNFTQGMTASISGMPINVTSVAANGNSFTASVPAHSPTATAQTLSVTTPAGPVNMTSAFTFTYGINVTPNAAPNTKLTSTDLDVTGAGFASISFVATDGTGPDDANGHVYLVPGAYNRANDGSSHKVNYEINECRNVLTISDNELVCQLNLVFKLDNTGAVDLTGSSQATRATMTVTAGQTTATSANFVAADVGKVITDVGNDFAPGTVITAVSGSTATLSQPAIGSTGGTALIDTAVATPVDSYTITVVNHGDRANAAADYVQSVVSKDSTFTVADY